MRADRARRRAPTPSAARRFAVPALAVSGVGTAAVLVLAAVDTPGTAEPQALPTVRLGTLSTETTAATPDQSPSGATASRAAPAGTATARPNPEAGTPADPPSSAPAAPPPEQTAGGSASTRSPAATSERDPQEQASEPSQTRAPEASGDADDDDDGGGLGDLLDLLG